MIPDRLEEALSEIYATASDADDAGFPCDLVLRWLAPAKVVLCANGSRTQPITGRSARRLSAAITYHDALSVELVAVRPDEGPDFTAAELRFFDAVVPHLQNAMRLRHELTRAGSRWHQVSGVLDRLSAAVMVLDARCSVVSANGRAKELLASGDLLRVVAGRLHAASPDRTQAMHRAVRRSARDTARQASGLAGLLLPRRDGATPLAGLLLPLVNAAGWFVEQAPAVALVVSNPEWADVPEPILMQLYRLTRAEAAMLSAIAQGCGLRDAASRVGVTRNTAKTHLARILAKMFAVGQIEVARTIAGGPGMLRWD